MIKQAMLTMTVLSCICVAGAQPAKHIGKHLPYHAVTNRSFQGISSLAISPKGRLWATWYAGKTPKEDQNNYVVLATSGDGGANWTEVLIVDPDGAKRLRAFDPEVWVAPDGKLRLSWSQSVGHDGRRAELWCLIIKDPESEQPEYGKPNFITKGIMMCKPIVLSTGEWVLPVSTWRKTDNSAKFVISVDQGKSWTVRSGCNIPKKDRNYDEHMFVERRDSSIWLLVRTKYGIGESISKDEGKTWSKLKPSSIAHTASRFFITRLASGNLLLVKHGPIKKKTGRSHLMAFISNNDGKSWRGGLMLDERKGVSYPDGQQSVDGTIYITYDYSRTGKRQIFMCSFQEKDAVAGQNVSRSVQLRKLISEGSGGEGMPVRTYGKVEFKAEPSGAMAINGAKMLSLEIGSKLFSDRDYNVTELPKIFAKAQFLQTTLEKKKSAKCSRDGMVYFLTPHSVRNRDSQAKQLLEQGFTPVKHKGIRLFNRIKQTTFCTIYQKECTKGENVKFGKWAVPVFLGK